MNYAFLRNPDPLLHRVGLPRPADAAQEARVLDALASLAPADLLPLLVIVGGFMDGIMARAHTIVLNASPALRETRHLFYRQHQEAKAVRRLVELYAAKGKDVMLVGHSWGGDAVVNGVARRTDAPIRLLGTLDPVSRKGPPAATPPNVALWINSYVDYRTASWSERSNIIARIGGPWEAVAAAHRNLPCAVDHHDAPGLFAGEVEAACLPGAKRRNAVPSPPASPVPPSPLG